ncbi:MAG: hypothetical protein NT001_00775, partial [Candidatus Woesearchaeota archaeon]|nr:hypothetical protein [Candidatus Woesearchaeota archaeon]
MEVSGAGLSMLNDLGSRVQLCNENSKDSGEITIRVQDELDRPVENAQILFSVGDVTCLMGITEKKGDVAEFKGRFPSGAIGSLLIQNPDYETYSKKFFNPKSDAQDLGTITLKGYAVKNVSAREIDINKILGDDGYGWQLNPAKKDLGSNDHVVVVLERILDDPSQEEVTAAADIRGAESKEIRLLPGKYKMSVTFIKENTSIVIPKEEICGDDSGGLAALLGEDECEDVGPTTISNNAPFTTQYNLKVEFADSLYQKNQIVFTGLNFNLADADNKVHDDLSEWSKASKYVTQSPDLFMPVFVSIG